MSLGARATVRPAGHRLYWRIWLAILASVVLVAVLTATAWRLLSDRPEPPNVTGFAELAAALLPPASAPADEQRAALEHWQRRLGADFLLRAADGRAIAGAGSDLLIVGREAGPRHHVMTTRGPAFELTLPDGRELTVRRAGRQPPPGPLLTFALIALAVGIGAYPVVRRLTRRLERLQAGVREWGGGNLGARVAVEGRDEVAQLAASFNEAAGRVEALVDSHRRLLANASHELRSPLARMRLGVELLSQQPTPQRRADLARDIAELDALIDEILTASRLDSGAELVREAVDLTALVAEEAARHGVVIEAPALSCEGNHRLLQRLVRNLLDNAQRYGGGSSEVQLRARAETIEIDVMDRGPGVPAAERERVFEPFYRMAGASEAHGGVGLGLALVRQIARQHGGDAVCQAHDGGGSVFRVTLPAAGAAVSRPASPAPVPSLPPAAA